MNKNLFTVSGAHGPMSSLYLFIFMYFIYYINVIICYINIYLNQIISAIHSETEYSLSFIQCEPAVGEAARELMRSWTVFIEAQSPEEGR